MPLLNVAQLAYLASEFTQLGKTLEQYENAHGKDPDVDLASLQQYIADIDAKADGLANAAAATIFDDSAAAYARLTSITERANETAASLAQKAAEFSKIAKIAAAMIDLAAALGSRNPLHVFQAIDNLAQSI